MTAKIVLALFSIFLFYLAAISRFKWSIDARPIVRPDIKPEMIKHDKDTEISIHQSTLNISC